MFSSLTQFSKQYFDLQTAKSWDDDRNHTRVFEAEGNLAEIPQVSPQKYPKAQQRVIWSDRGISTKYLEGYFDEEDRYSPSQGRYLSSQFNTGQIPQSFQL